jgi:hypothetical protein
VFHARWRGIDDHELRSTHVCVGTISLRTDGDVMSPDRKRPFRLDFELGRGTALSLRRRTVDGGDHCRVGIAAFDDALIGTSPGVIVNVVDIVDAFDFESLFDLFNFRRRIILIGAAERQ